MSSIEIPQFDWPYDDLLRCDQFPEKIRIIDHQLGFTVDKTSPILDHVYAHSTHDMEVITDFRFANDHNERYPRFRFIWHDIWVNDCFKHYRIHPALQFKNFVCSFNGTAHVSRKLLVSGLHRMGWFDPLYCSKNFSYSVDVLDGHLQDLLCQDRYRLYRKFFIGDASSDFFQSVHGFGHVRFEHAKNIYNLEQRITDSFVNLVSESLATSYYPFVSEKFLYSVITRGFFLTWAQPGWHRHLEQQWGFKPYSQVFDYSFDSIVEPVERLVTLLCMLSRFAQLGTDDWRDIYEIEKHTIEYNYDWYFSGSYLTFRGRHD